MLFASILTLANSISVFVCLFVFKQEVHSLRYCPLHKFSLSSLCFLKERPEREPKLDLPKPSVPAIPPKKPRPPKTNSLSRPGALPPRRPERPVGPLTHTRYCAALDAKGGSGVGQPKDTGRWPLGSLLLCSGRSGSEAGRCGLVFRITDENPGPGIFTLLTCGNSLCTLRARPAALQTRSARDGLPAFTPGGPLTGCSISEALPALWRLPPQSRAPSALACTAILWAPGRSLAKIVLVSMSVDCETLKGKGHASFRHEF